MAKNKLPKYIYIKMEADGDITYPVPSADSAELVEMGQTVMVGTYKLIEINAATGVVSEKRIRIRK